MMKNTNKLISTLQVILILSINTLISRTSASSTTSTSTSTSTSTITSSWSFAVFADWHGAESFAIYPITTTTSSSSTSTSQQSIANDGIAYNNSLRVLNHIRTTYGPFDLSLLPGDSNVGKWQKKTFVRKLRRELGLPTSNMTLKDVIDFAGVNCYGTMYRLFVEAGLNVTLMCIGDHELGGNPWFEKNQNDIKALPMFRQVLSSQYIQHSYLFNTTILGNVTSTPVGTPYEHTSYAYIHKNALFITVDAFRKTNQDFFDRGNSSGGEGSVTCTVTDDHLVWFENLLKEARNSAYRTNQTNAIRHIFVQAHIPILQPVRKINCSGQYMDEAAESLFWKIMRKYDVDVYFAGEVHATTVSKDPHSNLLQVVSRANRFNNFLTVHVEDDDRFTIRAYNEIGTEWRWNANYTEYGWLTVDKSQPKDTQIVSNGTLKLINLQQPLVRLKFEKGDVFPLQERIIVGMKYNQYKQMLGGYSKEIRGVNSTQGMINFGSYGQQYDAQIANLDFERGINGKNSATFNEHSRVAMVSFGPLGQGEIISFSLFFRTASTEETMLVAYGSRYTPHYRNNGHLRYVTNIFDSTSNDLAKDLLLLTLKNGTPRLYTSHQRYVVASIQEGVLNDGRWNSIAISMPSKSCFMSEIKMYVNGLQAKTTVIGDNTQMFFYTTGSLSLGGWGYSHAHNELLFPNIKPLSGGIDEFQLWGRSITQLDLRKSTRKKFERNLNVLCSGSESELSVGKRKPNKCRSRCRNNAACWGYELLPLAGGGFECFIYHERPTVGNETVPKGQCNPAL